MALSARESSRRYTLRESRVTSKDIPCGEGVSSSRQRGTSCDTDSRRQRGASIDADFRIPRSRTNSKEAPPEHQRERSLDRRDSKGWDEPLRSPRGAEGLLQAKEGVEHLKAQQAQWRRNHVALMERKGRTVTGSAFENWQRRVKAEKQAEVARLSALAEAGAQLVAPKLFGKGLFSQPQEREPSTVSQQPSEAPAALNNSATAQRVSPKTQNGKYRKQQKDAYDSTVQPPKAPESKQVSINTESTEQQQKDAYDSTVQPPKAQESKFEEVVRLARKHQLEMMEVKKIRDEFDRLDTSGDGKLDYEEFEECVRVICQIPPENEVPEHLWKDRWISCCKGKPREEVEFEDFLIWRLSVAYAEELLVPDEYERKLRQLARDNSISIIDVENLKKKFDRYDEDKSGLIEQEEFKKILCDIMEVTDPRDVSQAMLDRYYREADEDGSGEIDFFEFVTWYCKFN